MKKVFYSIVLSCLAFTLCLHNNPTITVKEKECFYLKMNL